MSNFNGDRHPLHSMCSYLGGYPPQVPRQAIVRWFRHRRVVLDPFCGSGTTLLEAALSGKKAIGIDKNPLAAAISAAKVQNVSAADAVHRVSELAAKFEPPDLHQVPESISLIYHERTLAQLCFLRQKLVRGEPGPEDAFLLGALLGIMHGKFRRDGSSAYLSIDMPNTFSMSPRYVARFVEEHGLRRPPVDVFGKLRERVTWLLREGDHSPGDGHRVVEGDATQLHYLLPEMGFKSVGGIVTSPPYLGVLRYGAFNWIRLWLLGKTGAEVDRALDSTDSLDHYLSFLVSFLTSAARVLHKGAPLVLVIGDVDELGSELNLAQRVWEELREVVPFEKEVVEVDDFDPSGKTTRIWGEDKKGRATNRDRVLVLRRA